MEYYEDPVPHVVIKNIFTDEQVESIKIDLLKLAPRLNPPSKTETAYDPHNKQYLAKRSGVFLPKKFTCNVNALTDVCLSPQFKKSIMDKNWVFGYIADAVTAPTLVSLYNDGDEYLEHKDDAVLTVIFYIHTGEFSGGEFYIKDKQVPVCHNSVIIFPSCAPHSVKKVVGSGRWSITRFIHINRNESLATSYESFLDPSDFKRAIDIIDNSKWVFKGFSSEDGIGKFWYMDLISEPFFANYIFNKIPKGPWKLERCYANGQTYGQDGDYHQDDITDNSWTFLLYISKNPVGYHWEGQLMFKDGTFEEYETNKAVLFKGNSWHRGMAPSRFVTDLRISVAWKLTAIQ